MRTIVSSVAMIALVAALNMGASAQGAPGAPAAGAPQGGAPRGGGGGRGGGARLQPATAPHGNRCLPDGGIIPAKYTGRGGNVQPAFKFSGAPATTVSYAIIFHDVDVAARRQHGGRAALGRVEHSRIGERHPRRQGARWRRPGRTRLLRRPRSTRRDVRYHHYVFELYALNANLELDPKASRRRRS